MYKLILTTFLFFLLTTSSFAYLGPGVGGGVIAATVGVIVAIFAALFGLIWFPVKRLLKKRKESKENKQNKVD
tara:strand:- start:3943 stop:4161 length:219 start_codon:yes stop_codon:yes gene_type:complete